MLAARLQSLVDHGVLERRQYQDRPPRCEYRLTENGEALEEANAATDTDTDTEVLTEE